MREFLKKDNRFIDNSDIRHRELFDRRFYADSQFPPPLDYPLFNYLKNNFIDEYYYDPEIAVFTPKAFYDFCEYWDVRGRLQIRGGYTPHRIKGIDVWVTENAPCYLPQFFLKSEIAEIAKQVESSETKYSVQRLKLVPERFNYDMEYKKNVEMAIFRGIRPSRIPNWQPEYAQIEISKELAMDFKEFNDKFYKPNEVCISELLSL